MAASSDPPAHTIHGQVRGLTDQGDIITVSHGVWRLALLDRPRSAERDLWVKTLNELLPAGSEVVISAAFQDRWGRWVGMITTPTSLQTALLERGVAVVNPMLWSNPSATTALPKILPLLYAAEDRARRAQKGLWAAGNRSIEPSSASIATNDGQMHLIEGTIQSVSEVRDRWYLNFGTDWRQDFTVQLDKAQAKAWAATRPVPLSTLKGQRVRVRGWPRYANGPLIELTSPFMIELSLDEGHPLR
jgi:hypothetical protein